MNTEIPFFAGVDAPTNTQTQVTMSGLTPKGILSSGEWGRYHLLGAIATGHWSEPWNRVDFLGTFAAPTNTLDQVTMSGLTPKGILSSGEWGYLRVKVVWYSVPVVTPPFGPRLPIVMVIT